MRNLLSHHSLPLFLAVVLFAAGSTRGDIVINEIIHNPEAVPDQDGEWFELHNTDTVDVDIDGWTIECHGGFSHVINHGEPLIVPADGYCVLGRSDNSAINGNAPVAYSYGTDIPLGGADAVWILDLTGEMVDSVDYGPGAFPHVPGAAIELFNPRMDRNNGRNWATSKTRWSGGDLGTPGEQNSIYSEFIRDEILITEILHRPAQVGPGNGEWFEVYNTSDRDIDMEGLVFIDADGLSFRVEGSFVVPSEEFAIFTVNSDSNSNGGHWSPLMYDWGSTGDFNLSNGDFVALKDEYLDIDSVDYHEHYGWPDPEGASIILTSFVDDNNEPEFWDIATLREPGFGGTGGDLGSPGTLGTGQNAGDGSAPRLLFARPNFDTNIRVVFSEPVDPSAADPAKYSIDNGIGMPLAAAMDPMDPSTVNLTVDTLGMGLMYYLSVYEIDDLAGNRLEYDTASFTYLPEALPGDIIVTEIMYAPEAVGSPFGEWFEVYNTTNLPIDMNGWTIQDTVSDEFIVSGTVMVPPFGFAVFTVNDDSSMNGGMAVAYDSCGCPCASLYDWGTAGDFSLQSGDQIVLKAGSMIIDSVGWAAGGSWPYATGSSMILKHFAYSNLDVANWDTAKVREPGYLGAAGDKGSPGTMGIHQHPESPLAINARLPMYVFPAAGDTVVGQIKVGNPLSAPIRAERWITLEAPDSAFIFEVSAPAGWTVGFDTVTTSNFVLPLKAVFPAGEYTLWTLMGTYPDDTLAVSTLKFTKEPSGLVATEPGSMGPDIPLETFIDQNYPNPFNPSTTIQYGLSEDAHVTLKVYNMLGREVATLVNEYLAAGYKSVVWNGRNSSGAPVSSGMYFYRVEAGAFVTTHRMILLK